MSKLFVLVLIAVAIVIFLILVAGYYLACLYHLRKRQQLEAENSKILLDERRRSINKSITILSRAVLKQELTYTEAAIRISGLLDGLSVSDDVRLKYAVFFDLRDVTAHIPILESWQALSARQKFEHNQERERHEAHFEKDILKAADQIQLESF